MQLTSLDAPSFLHGVDGWVGSLVFTGVRGFDDLLRRLPGVYPSDVIASVRRLCQQGKIAEATASRLLPGDDQNVRPTLVRPSLPIPHPLDYDWRFTSSTSAYLLNEASKFRQQADTLVCLGTPTVFQAALRRADAHAVLVDANSAVVRYFENHGGSSDLLQSDLFAGSIPRLHSSIIVSDPPWYSDYMEAFIRAASQVCKVGGNVLMSLPPKGTRPGVVDELRRFLSVTFSLGFELVEKREGVLRYDSPPFEHNALRAAGVHFASTDWRCGDLYIFRLRAAIRSTQVGNFQTLSQWSDEEFCGMRVRLRNTRAMEFADPSLQSIIDGDIVPSVSRRHPLRRVADVWTSGNRAFRCAGTNILHHVFQAAIHGENPAMRVAFALKRRLSAQEQELILAAAEQVAALARLEQTEFGFIGVG